MLDLIQAMPRTKGKLPLHRLFLQVVVQEGGKQAPVKLNKEASGKVTKLGIKKKNFQLIQRTRTKLPRLAGEE